MRRSFVLATLLSAFAAPALAQTTYAAGRDTVRFRDVTRGEIRLTTPQGDIETVSEHDATVALTRLRGDTAQAWYESLTLGTSGPMGARRPATEAALRVPFTLRLDNRGRTTLIAAPTFPASFEGITDLSHQFDDFFMRLPVQTLRVGLAWSDTSTRTDSTAERFMHWQSVATYRVERDTVVRGVPALVVRLYQQLTSRSEGPVPGQPARAETSLAGTEEGYFLFAPNPGRLLARRREGRLAGDVVLRSGAGAMTFKQAYSYTNALDAVP
jgi:hypothetical protein